MNPVSPPQGPPAGAGAGRMLADLLYLFCAGALVVTPGILFVVKNRDGGWRQAEILAADLVAAGAVGAGLVLRFVRRSPRRRAALLALCATAYALGSIPVTLLSKGGVFGAVYIATASALLALGLVGLTRISTASRPLVVAVCSLTGVGFLVFRILRPWVPYPRGFLGLLSWFEAGVAALALGVLISVPVLLRRGAI